MVYDELFTPLTQRPKHFDTYVLPSEWPRIDFTSYRALLLTCKEVKEEATTHFEGHYLRDVMVYFDNVVDLRDLHSKLERAAAYNSEKLAEMRVCFHTLPWGMKRHLSTEPMASLPFYYFNRHTNICCVRALIDSGLDTHVPLGMNLQRTCRVIPGSSQNPPVSCTHKMRGSAKLDVVERTGQSGPFRTTFKVISRQICSKISSMYTQMMAPISFFGGHEAWGLPTNYDGNVLNERKNSTGDGLWPGTKKYEQELKEKYELDA